MGGQELREPERAKKHICAGLLAHVDAGKTTLAEAMLYLGGSIRKMGRVDHGDAFLDNFALERRRGITIFSKQAHVEWKDLSLTLLDTPGHVDFSAEMERTLQVLDYAVLVISGTDGVQGHVQTLWRLLARYDIPVFLFVNKMDLQGADREGLMRQLQSGLDSGCVDFGQGTDFLESAAVCEEALMEEYLETGTLRAESIAMAIAGRKLFPCYFGSALHLEGVGELLDGILQYSLLPQYPQEFGARVYKIARDGEGKRLTYLKVTGGVLRVKMPVDNRKSAGKGAKAWEEKADRLFLCDGARFLTVEEVAAGEVCAVAGLTSTFVGQGLGAEEENNLPLLAPVLTYRLLLPEGSDVTKALAQLRQLEEEDPQLYVSWKQELSEIHVQVMGEVQTEVLKQTILERFGLEVEFGEGGIVYQETIAGPVEGIGHFEPLRHYAEVHLLLEPGERGSGLQFASLCSEDMLDRNWQRLVLSHLEEERHVGVLTGSGITDMRILLIGGRAHQKHTEGGDFRQAVRRALRQGLMQAESVLLEPVYDFTLETPPEAMGRAMSDLQRMGGSFEISRSDGDCSVLTGRAPVSGLQGYQRQLSAYTGGRGRLSCVLGGYEPCHNALEVIQSRGYRPEEDLENPSASVFCVHGAGTVVEWDKVREYAHVESRWNGQSRDACLPEDASGCGLSPVSLGRTGAEGSRGERWITQEEVEEIFRQTYGKKKEEGRRRFRRYRGGEAPAQGRSGDAPYQYKPREKKEEYLLVDGYNIIFAWEELRELSRINMDSARDRLIDILCNYQGYVGNTLILVFDAYKVKGNPGSVLKIHNIYVVYTKEAETADQYIEKTVHRIAPKAQVTVATGDALEQMIIWGEGALRLSARGLQEAIREASSQGKVWGTDRPLA